MSNESESPCVKSLKERIDVAIHLACDFYSSPAALTRFPGFSRHHVGAVYCVLLKLRPEQWRKLKTEVQCKGFEKAMKPFAESAQWTVFLSHMLVIHVNAMIDLVDEVNSVGASDEIFKMVFAMFDRTQQTSLDKKVWASVIEMLLSSDWGAFDAPDLNS